MKQLRRTIGLIGLVSLLALTGCAAASARLMPEAAMLTPTSAPVPTATRDLAPTPLPAPTLIPPPGGLQVAAGQQSADASPDGPGITIVPRTGEPKDVVMVTGTGWPPFANVTLAWGPEQGATGPAYWQLIADVNGSLSVGLIVPPRERWPGGYPFPGAVLQLRATTPSILGRYYYADFTYVLRPTPTVQVAGHPTATVTCPACW